MERTADYVKLSLRQYDKLKKENKRYHRLIEKNFVEIYPCTGSSVVTKNKAIKQLALNAKNDIDRIINDSDKKVKELETKVSALEACSRTMYSDLSRKNKRRYLKVTMMKNLINPRSTITLKGL